ncbi:hypothetical protein C6497_01360 [Candidatus Poribacteria bacterium]|nr:MAG: hypothetical protein C6497_01360 [Candidatus Poribacteria bacterium]
MLINLRLRYLFVLTFLMITLGTSPAFSFIEREYTIREVLDACTNIVFGEIKSVNPRRLQAVVSVKDNVKGESNLNEIKMNFATGQYKQGTSPQKMVRLVKKGMPIIVFYRDHYGIDSMCFIDNTWFQMRAYRGTSGKSWWSFTHIDPMMDRTFTGKTIEFQKIVRDMLAGKMWVTAGENSVKILVLSGNSTPPTWSQSHVYTNTMTYEYQALRNIKNVGKRDTVFESTKNRKLKFLNDADILWIGYEEISSFGRQLLPKDTENKIKKFVNAGGIVIVSGQDSTDKRPCGIGWLHGELTGVESTPNRNFVLTNVQSTIFSSPNKVKSGTIYVDDAWVDWEKTDKVLATIPNSNELVVGIREYGKGFYIITSLCNYKKQDVSLNKDLMENIIHYAVNKL